MLSKYDLGFCTFLAYRRQILFKNLPNNYLELIGCLQLITEVGMRSLSRVQGKLKRSLS